MKAILPPHNKDAEITVLSTALLKKDCLQELLLHKSDIFFFEYNIHIFNAAYELAKTETDISLIEVFTKLEQLNISIDQNIKAELLRTPPALNFKYILNQLIDMRNRRSIMDSTVDLFNSVADRKIDYNKFVDEIVDIANNANSNDDVEYCDIQDLADSEISDLFSELNFVKTGLKNLDRSIIGFSKGQLIIIAGTPGSGKTTLAFQIACNIGDILVFSLEMKREQMYSKLLSRVAEVDSMHIIKNDLTELDKQRINFARPKIKKSIKIRLFDNVDSFQRILSIIRIEFMKNKNLKGVMIDYLQLLDLPGYQRVEALEKMTRSLKKAAMEFDVPFIVLSQLSRDLKKQNRDPMMSDLRGSGSIEQDADTIIFTHENDDGNKIIIGKGRQVKIGRVPNIIFEKEFNRFVNIDIENSKMFGYD